MLNDSDLESVTAGKQTGALVDDARSTMAAWRRTALSVEATSNATNTRIGVLSEQAGAILGGK